MNIYTHSSPLSFDQTIETLKTKLADAKFGVLAAIPLSEKFKDKGLAFDSRITILEVCNPFEAYTAIGINPTTVNFLPCKLVVTETQGKVTIPMARPSGLIALLGDPSLQSFALKIETTLTSITDTIV